MAPFARDIVDSLELLTITEDEVQSSMTVEATTAASPSSVSSPKPQGRRRSRSGHTVSFVEDEKLTAVHEIPFAKDELSQEEFQATYLSKEDLRRIQKENRETLKDMKWGNFLDNDKHCFRGLECHLPNTRRERFERVSRVLQAVMDEQDSSGRIQPHWIHTVYCELTARSEELSIMLGLFDEHAVAPIEAGYLL